MVRTLEIDIWGHEWDISGSVRGNPSKLELFGMIETKNNKIVYITNYEISIKDINAAKKMGGIFSEQCIFKHGDYSFEGDFIDAFIYIENAIAKYAKKQGSIRRAV
jgi:hypothetical protein